MAAMANADERLVESETEMICRIYRWLNDEEIDAFRVAQLMKARIAAPKRLAADLARQTRHENEGDVDPRRLFGASDRLEDPN